jgi:predicted ATP-grasp superfamily ATP-dependent carboligase
LTAQTVLIAALSGRGLAAAARRAGYEPLVADAFCDSDTHDSAAAVRCLADATRLGFRAKPLIAALEALAGEASRVPIGLVLGSGFEDRPKLIASLTRRFPLLGNDAETTAQTKSPAAFFRLLDTLRIAHPQTQLAPPADLAGWICKRVGGSGGTHIVAAAQAVASPRHYYQRLIAGEPASVLAVAARGNIQIAGISRQWTVGSGPRPFRYGGAAGPARLAPPLEAQMLAAVEAVCTALGLVGLVSFDFLLAGGAAHLLEANPRPSATLDVFDDAVGSLFRAHLAACRGDAFDMPAPKAARAAAILYADAGPLTIGAPAWPSWSADRPRPGVRILGHRPIATVFGGGETAEQARLSCCQRLDELAQMLYGRAPDRERNKNAEVHRPRPQRIGPRSEAR